MMWCTADAVGQSGLQLFVDAGAPVDETLVHSLIKQVILEKITSSLGQVTAQDTQRPLARQPPSPRPRGKLQSPRYPSVERAESPPMVRYYIYLPVSSPSSDIHFKVSWPDCHGQVNSGGSSRSIYHHLFHSEPSAKHASNTPNDFFLEIISEYFSQVSPIIMFSNNFEYTQFTYKHPKLFWPQKKIPFDILILIVNISGVFCLMLFLSQLRALAQLS